MASTAIALSSGADDPKNVILQRYDNAIRYYWGASKYNKRAYKMTRYLTILLGALVTLISSLQSADFVSAAQLKTLFSVLTPVLAATLAVVGGISQAFQWGAAWSDMTLTATRLQKERDRVLVTSTANLDATKEMDLLNDLVVSETQGFFQRLFGSATSAKPDKS